MRVEHWSPFVRFYLKAPHEGKPLFEVRAWLACPVCRYVNDVASPTRVMPVILTRQRDGKVVIQAQDPLNPSRFNVEVTEVKKVFPLQEYIKLTTDTLGQSRHCGGCGIPSNMTPTDLAALMKKAEARITAEFLHQQVVALTLQTGFQDALQEVREQRIGRSAEEFQAYVLEQDEVRRSARVKAVSKDTVKKPTPRKSAAKKPAKKAVPTQASLRAKGKHSRSR